MPLTINTNLSSLIIQTNLKQSFNALNQAIERMTTGFKINGAKDHAANYSISTQMNTKLSAYQVAEDNVSAGLDLLSTASGTLEQIDSFLTRLRALQEQSAYGTYSKDSLRVINSEANSIVDEITRLYTTTEFNGKKLFLGTGDFEDTDEVDTNIYVKDVTSFKIGTTYSLASAEDLVQLSNLVNSGVYTRNIDFQLIKDIDMSGVDFVAIGDETNKFKGNFDGQNFAIKNLKENSRKRYNGLFGYIEDAKVKNINLENVDLSCSVYAGGIAGYVYKSEITNCRATGNVTSGTAAGGVVGTTHTNGSSKIEGCFFSGTVETSGSSTFSGGIVGDCSGIVLVSRCYAEGSINAGRASGGIIGATHYGYSNIENCYSNCKIRVSGGMPVAGGLVGETHGSGSVIKNSYATGEITLIGSGGAGSSKGSLVGAMFDGGEVINCVSSSELSTNLLGNFSSADVVITNSDVWSLAEMQKESVMSNYGFTTENGWYYEHGKTPQLLHFKPEDEEESEDVLMNKQATVLQVGINSSGSSTIRFNTSFDLTGLKELRHIGLNDVSYIPDIDEFLLRVNSKHTELGAVQNRLESALEEINTHYENLLSSRSTLRDADVAQESSAYIRNQILQQASATLLATANQTPAIALQLL